MYNQLASLTAATAFVVCCIIFELIRPVHKRWILGKTSNLPPGPTGLPVLGNLLKFWASRSGGEMNSYLLSLRSYGEMTTLHMGSHLWVVLNSERVADEIINKRSKSTSGRPHMPIASSLVSNGKRSVVQPTETWTESRRMMRPLLTAKWLQSFEEWQHLESLRMLLGYLQDPSSWYLHLSRYSVGMIYGPITGESLDKSNEQLQEFRKVTMQFLGTVHETTVDFFPGLEWIPRPFQPWRAKWKAMGLFHYSVFKSWWVQIRATAAGTNSKESWVRDVLLNPTMKFEGDDDEALYITTSLISAGSEGTRMTLNTFVMASMAYPEAFRRCRVELDAACGVVPERLPDAQDAASTPYVSAFIKECLRWKPTVPIVPPHMLTEEITYDGFIFPKGTNFIINHAAISSNCDDPETFRPERWIDGNETQLTHGFWGFGGGRRVCIGYKAVQPALYLAISRLIFCFDFYANGEYDVKRLNQWSNAEPFPTRIMRRGKPYEQLILKATSSSSLGP